MRQLSFEFSAMSSFGNTATVVVLHFCIHGSTAALPADDFVDCGSLNFLYSMMLRKCKMQVEVMSLTRWSLNKIRTYQYGKGFFWMGNGYKQKEQKFCE